MSKHTPGPWEVIGSTIAPSGLLADEVATVAIQPRDGEKQANARLIASAPELLEALSTALTFITDPGATDGREAVEAVINAAINLADPPEECEPGCSLMQTKEDSA